MSSFFLSNWSPPDDPARPLPAEGRPWPSDDDDELKEEEIRGERASVEQTLILQYIRPGHISPSLHARDDQDYEHDDGDSHGDEKCYNLKIKIMAIIVVAHIVIFSWSEL